MTKAGQGTSTESGDGIKTISPTIRDIEAGVYERFGKRCADLGIFHRQGFKRAIEAWERCENARTALDLPPFDGLGRTVREEFSRRCAENKLTPEAAIQDAVIVWLRNFAFIDPPAPKKGKRRKQDKRHEGLPL